MTIIFLFLIPAHHLFQLPRGHLREKCTPQTIKKRRQVAQSDQQTINYHSRSTARKPDGMPWPWGTVYIPSSEEREVLHLRHKMTQIRAIILLILTYALVTLLSSVKKTSTSDVQSTRYRSCHLQELGVNLYQRRYQHKEWKSRQRIF